MTQYRRKENAAASLQKTSRDLPPSAHPLKKQDVAAVHPETVLTVLPPLDAINQGVPVQLLRRTEEASHQTTMETGRHADHVHAVLVEVDRIAAAV